MTLSLDREYGEHIAAISTAMAAFPPLAAHDIQGRRDRVAQMAASWKSPPFPESLERSTKTATSKDGTSIPIIHVKRRDIVGPSAAVVHFHGGGLIALNAESTIGHVAVFADATKAQFFSVDYRLAPEHPYPTPLEDAWAGLQYVIDNAEALGVDPARIAVAGESAGGNLAAGVAILARDKKLSPPLARQVVMFPMLDDRNKDVLGPDTPRFWDEADTETAWKAYLGDKVGGEEVEAYAAPARLEDARGMPPLYLDVGQLDLFVKENVDYVAKHVRAGVETEFHLFPGLPHAFGTSDPGLYASRQTKENRIRIYNQL